MIALIFRLAGIIVMVFAVLAEVQMFIGLGIAYLMRFHSTSGGVDTPMRHWHLTDTLGIPAALLIPGLIFALGFCLRRAGTHPLPDHAPQQTI